MNADINTFSSSEKHDQTYCRNSFEKMREAFVLLDYSLDDSGTPDKYRVIYANPAFNNTPGFPAESEGQLIHELFPGNSEELVKALNEVTLTTNTDSVELYFNEQDMYFSVSIFTPAPKRLGCIFRDVSRSKHLDSMLSAERNRIENVLEDTNAGNWYWNVQSGELIINERWASIIGYTVEELSPVSVETWKRLTQPDDLQHAMNALERLFLKKSNYYDVEFRQKHKDGYWVWINARGKVIEWTEEGSPLYMSGVHLDITDRKATEQALKESEENMRVTLKSIGDAVIATGTSGLITQMNPVAETLTGWTLNEAEGKDLTSVFQIINSQTRQNVQNPVEKVLNSGKAVTLANHTILVAKDGTEHQIADSGAPIRNIHGDIIGVVLVFRDVTKEYALQEQLQQAQKMEAIGQLAGGIAHDFNNLLQAILGYAEIALEEKNSKENIHDSIDQIIKAGNQARNMTSQLLAFSRRQVLQMAVLNLNEVVSDLTKIILRLIGEHIHLDIQADKEIRTVKADRSQLTQILTNLCVNARDAMPNGGTIIIETSSITFDDQYCQDNIWAKPGKYNVLSVTDTGCGMCEDTIKQVFEPFFSTKEVGKGSGLGLSTVYGLVQQHEGLIKIASEPGKGTTVKIFLPQVDEQSTPPDTAEKGSVPEGTETILVAEDDDMVRDVCTRILRMGGYNVMAASNGEEALEIFEKHKDRINLALLDIVMPKMGGKGVYERIRVTHPEMRFLFASGYSMGDLHTNFILDQGISLIHKPYGSADLLKKIREILDKA